MQELVRIDSVGPQRQRRPPRTFPEFGGASLWPLNQLETVTGWIDRDAYDEASVSEWTRIARQCATGGLDGSDCRRHILHVEDHMGDGILHVVRIAMLDHDRFAFVGFCCVDSGAEVHK